jgi:hypothetical protein
MKFGLFQARMDVGDFPDPTVGEGPFRNRNRAVVKIASPAERAPNAPAAITYSFFAGLQKFQSLKEKLVHLHS